MTLLHVICGLSPPPPPFKNPGYAYDDNAVLFRLIWKKFCNLVLYDVFKGGESPSQLRWFKIAKIEL